MAFIDKELEKLSRQIINTAVQKQMPIARTNSLVQRLRQAILRRQTKLPRVF